eukprot:31307-Pelagococcus_subviridis.AAC.15
MHPTMWRKWLLTHDVRAETEDRADGGEIRGETFSDGGGERDAHRGDEVRERVPGREASLFRERLRGERRRGRHAVAGTREASRSKRRLSHRERRGADAEGLARTRSGGRGRAAGCARYEQRTAAAARRRSYARRGALSARVRRRRRRRRRPRRELEHDRRLVRGDVVERLQPARAVHPQHAPGRARVHAPRAFHDDFDFRRRRVALRRDRERPQRRRDVIRAALRARVVHAHGDLRGGGGRRARRRNRRAVTAAPPRREERAPLRARVQRRGLALLLRHRSSARRPTRPLLRRDVRRRRRRRRRRGRRRPLRRRRLLARAALFPPSRRLDGLPRVSEDEHAADRERRERPRVDADRDGGRDERDDVGPVVGISEPRAEGDGAAARTDRRRPRRGGTRGGKRRRREHDADGAATSEDADGATMDR